MQGGGHAVVGIGIPWCELRGFGELIESRLRIAALLGDMAKKEEGDEVVGFGARTLRQSASASAG